MGAGVIAVGEVEDLFLELGDRGERATADGFLGDDIEPDLDLVEPGGVGGSEMDMVAGPSGEPALDLGMLVGAVVVDVEVDVEVRGHVGLDVLEEAHELLMPMPWLALGDNLTGGHVQGGRRGWWYRDGCSHA